MDTLFFFFYFFCLFQTVEKRSEKLQRNAIWKREIKINRLPRYLCIQYVRFYWKTRTPTAHDPSTGTACKMKRRVQFTDQLDLFKFCNDEVKKNIFSFSLFYIYPVAEFCRIVFSFLNLHLLTWWYFVVFDILSFIYFYFFCF